MRLIRLAGGGCVVTGVMVVWLSFMAAGCAPENEPARAKWKDVESLHHAQPSAPGKKTNGKKPFGNCSSDDLANFTCD